MAMPRASRRHRSRDHAHRRRLRAARRGGATATRLRGAAARRAGRGRRRAPLLPVVPLRAARRARRVDDPFGDAPWAVGELARRRGAEVPGRLVASSKSWLVHPASTAPRRSCRGAPPERRAAALSPVDAARAPARARAPRVGRRSIPDAPLAEQEVVLTVPASFDEVARELTLEAAQPRRPRADAARGAAGRVLRLDGARRARRAVAARSRRSGGEALVLVVRRRRRHDRPVARRASAARARRRVERVAVGPHLLLGGDNMDLALAHLAEPRLAAEGESSIPRRFAQLVAACRAAKEALLGEAPPDDAPVTVARRAARGSSAATRTARLTREEVERVVLDGFFPRGRRATRARSAPAARSSRSACPTSATSPSPATSPRSSRATRPPGARRNARAPQRRRLPRGAHRRARRRGARRAGAGRAGRRRLPDADPDLAVARGAVAYALAPRGQGRAHRRRRGARLLRRRRAGRGAGARRSASCRAAPRRASRTCAAGRTFALAVGRPVRFDVFASDEGDARAGRRGRRRRGALRAPAAARDARSRRRADARGARRARGRAHARGHARSRVRRGCERAAPRRFRLRLPAPRRELRAERVAAEPAAARLALAGRPPPRRGPRGCSSAPSARPAPTRAGREAKDLLRELERVARRARAVDHRDDRAALRRAPARRARAPPLGRPRARLLAARRLVRAPGLRRSARLRSASPLCRRSSTSGWPSPARRAAGSSS